MNTSAVRYRVKNWSEYKQALIRRGDVTLWVSEDVLSEWNTAPASGRRGRPRIYSDLAIECMLTLRLLYHLPLRGAEGFLRSLFRLMGCELVVPSFVTLSRRQAGIPRHLGVEAAAEPRHILIDSTGLKVFGEGEWKVRQHGTEQRRTWRKLHVAVDADSQEIVAVSLTDNATGDATEFPELLLQIEGSIRRVTADGAYDTWECRYQVVERGAEAIIPPRSNAVEKDAPEIEEVRVRDAAVRQIAEEGSKAWKEESGYHRRSLVETAMFRIKRILGSDMRARAIQNQIGEAVVKSKILNRFIQEGMPRTVAERE